MTRTLPTAALLSILSLGLLAQPSARYDLVIVNGSIVDGTGNPWYRADVGIRNGHIATIGAIGTIDRRAAAAVVDAAGKIVAPGFIDLHTHSDVPLLVDGTAQSAVRQGVTLDVLGESASIAPLEGVVLDSFKLQMKRRYNLDVDWTTVSGYFARLQRQGVSINVATSVAPQQVKRAVMGYDERPASSAELAKMKTLVAQAMREGAVGLSTAYEGGGYDNPEEIFAMAKVAAEYGGYYASHVGSEGYQLVEEVQKAITVAEVAGLPVHIYHLKIRGRKLWGQAGSALTLIEDARRRGLEITANQYPYTAMQHPWGALFPEWAKNGPPGKIVQVLSDPANREKLKNDPQFTQYVEEHGGFEGIVASRFSNPKDKPLEGKSIAAIAKLRGDRDPADTCFNLIVEEGGFVDGVHHNMSDDDVKTIMRLPWVAIASDGTALRPEGVLGDGLPHPRSYGTNPRVLGKYVRDEHVLTLEDAVRKMTSLPAQILRLRDRGLLREGYWADLVVFDPVTIADRGTYERPAQYAAGVTHVLVNGVAVVRNGEHTGAKPGQIVHGAGHATTISH
jgi:N-acyl-D-aspartate/D-glutamate deacylase